MVFYMFFDVETTGLLYSKPYLVSIAYNVYELDDDNCKQLVHEYYKVIQPPTDDYIFPKESVAVHGITTEYAKETGVPIQEILNDLHTLFDTYTINTIIAHNIEFDIKALSMQMNRYDKKKMRKNPDDIALSEKMYNIKTYCTMKENVEITKLYSVTNTLVGNKRKFPNKFKYPKLVELYDHLFPGETFIQHNAKHDMEACAKCYFKIVHDL